MDKPGFSPRKPNSRTYYEILNHCVNDLVKETWMEGCLHGTQVAIEITELDLGLPMGNYAYTWNPEIPLPELVSFPIHPSVCALYNGLNHFHNSEYKGKLCQGTALRVIVGEGVRVAVLASAAPATWLVCRGGVLGCLLVLCPGHTLIAQCPATSHPQPGPGDHLSS